MATLPATCSSRCCRLLLLFQCPALVHGQRLPRVHRLPSPQPRRSWNAGSTSAVRVCGRRRCCAAHAARSCAAAAAPAPSRRALRVKKAAESVIERAHARQAVRRCRAVRKRKPHVADRRATTLAAACLRVGARCCVALQGRTAADRGAHLRRTTPVRAAGGCRRMRARRRAQPLGQRCARRRHSAQAPSERAFALQTRHTTSP